MGRTLSEEDIKEAITHAKAKEFVEEVGRGYDNHINVRGANLSGGQKQRILIARALTLPAALPLIIRQMRPCAMNLQCILRTRRR